MYVAEIGLSTAEIMSKAPMRKSRNARVAEPVMRMGRRPSADMMGHARMVPRNPMMVR